MKIGDGHKAFSCFVGLVRLCSARTFFIRRIMVLNMCFVWRGHQAIQSRTYKAFSRVVRKQSTEIVLRSF